MEVPVASWTLDTKEREKFVAFGLFILKIYFPLCKWCFVTVQTFQVSINFLPNSFSIHWLSLFEWIISLGIKNGDFLDFSYSTYSTWHFSEMPSTISTWLSLRYWHCWLLWNIVSMESQNICLIPFV